MLASLAFVPEMDVIDSFSILMQDFPESAMNIGKCFEEYYLGKKLLNGTRRNPVFSIRLWNMFSRVKTNQARTTTVLKVGIMSFKHKYHAHIHLLGSY